MLAKKIRRRWKISRSLGKSPSFSPSLSLSSLAIRWRGERTVVETFGNLITILPAESLRLRDRLQRNHSASVIPAFPRHRSTFTSVLQRSRSRSSSVFIFADVPRSPRVEVVLPILDAGCLARRQLRFTSAIRSRRLISRSVSRRGFWKRAETRLASFFLLQALDLIATHLAKLTRSFIRITGQGVPWGARKKSAGTYASKSVVRSLYCPHSRGLSKRTSVPAN